jgi:hypothetical protein
MKRRVMMKRSRTGVKERRQKKLKTRRIHGLRKRRRM